MVAWCRRRRAGNAGIVRALFNRQGVAIAGRNGTLAQTGGTGATALHPTYGSVESSGALISHSLAIPGVGTLPMSLAQGARTNLLLRSQDTTDATWSKTIAGVTISGVAPDGSATANVFLPDNAAAVASAIVRQTVAKAASALTYTFSIYAKAKETSSLRLWVRDSATAANRAETTINISSVSATSTTQIGTFTSASATVTSIGGGWVRATLTLTTSTETGIFAEVRNNIVGDGTSGVYIWGAQLEQASFPGLYIPTTTTALTRAADNILWTPPSALSTVSGEVVAIAAPYLWSAGAGVAHPSATNARRWGSTGSNYDYRGATTDESTGHADVGTQSVAVTSLADASGIIRQTCQKWDARQLSYYQGSSLAGIDNTLSLPWAAITSMSVGSSAAAAHWFGFVGLIYVPGGLTGAERIALASVTGGSLTYVG